MNNREKPVSEAGRSIRRLTKFRYMLIIEGIAVGLLAGGVIVAFRLAIEKATTMSDHLAYFAQNSILMIPVYILVMIAVAMCITALVKGEPLIAGSGIPQLEGELGGRIESVWWRVLPMKFIGGVLAIGSGMSLGREGPSVQLGAMVGKGFANLTRGLKTEEKMLMTCGAGAGLSAAFNAPLAGVIFALEELHKNFSEEVLLCTMSGAISADFVCRYVFGLKPIFTIGDVQMLPLKYYGLIILLGIILGVMGIAFNASIKIAQNLYDKIPARLARILVPAMLVVPAAFFYPHILGGGSDIVDQLAAGKWILAPLITLFILKWLFTVICFSSGTAGGIFLPQLVLGAVLGTAFYNVCAGFGVPEAYLCNFVVLGMAGYFSAVVRAPITGIVLICEMSGSLSQLLTLSLVSLSAYVAADILKGKPVYEQLLERILSKGGFEIRNEKKVLTEVPIHIGSRADGIAVKDFPLPKRCLIVSISRTGEELVPNGSTQLRGGDILTILSTEKEKAALERALQRMCRKIEKEE